MDSLAGQFLFANPKLPDSNFYKSVVFMIEHSESGALGVIINQQTEVGISELWTKLHDENIASNAPAFWGGPVPGENGSGAGHGVLPVANADTHRSIRHSVRGTLRDGAPHDAWPCRGKRRGGVPVLADATTNLRIHPVSATGSEVNTTSG